MPQELACPQARRPQIVDEINIQTRKGATMSRRLKITLPDPICDELSDMAATTGEPVSRVAAQIVRSRFVAVLDSETLHSLRPERSKRPTWLQPARDDDTWRTAMWEAIEALCARYSRTLAGLSDRWWENESVFETLCALASWRRSIDEAGDHPQEELEFQARLIEYGATLRREATTNTGTWLPGLPPDDPDIREPRTRKEVAAPGRVSTNASSGAQSWSPTQTQLAT